MTHRQSLVSSLVTDYCRSAPGFSKRNRGLLKYKPFHDAEAIIIGFVAGKESKQGNVLGKIGALKVRWRDIDFEIGSDMTMAERPS